MKKKWIVRVWTSLLGLLLVFQFATALGAVETSALPKGLWHEGPSVQVDPDIARLNQTFTRLAEQLRPAVVQVRVAGASAATSSLGPRQPRRAQGSGFLISQDGYVVTAQHVVGEGSQVEVVLFDGRHLRGQVLGKDRRVDLALIKVEGASDLPFLPLGDSDRLKLGELVMALGSPFGLDYSVSLGIVGRRGVNDEAPSPAFEFIQTDAAVNPGNSGGPLVNMAGQVVGVTTMAARGGSLGFSIPINLVKALLPQLLERGAIIWGWLGIQIEEVDDELAELEGLPLGKGVLVSAVLPGQPADQGGIRVGDIILSIDEVAINSPKELIRVVSTSQVGKEVRITLRRKGQDLQVSVRIGAYPERESEEG
ncbi:MAG: trypsin-like peptidase domain-containing protein [candidate division NC10 bacterium]|nr:trypsin-like peptidase domain-containing protein [candidate division NC10 bacterium]